MTTLQKNLSKERRQPAASLRTKCDDWLRRMEKQKTRAREMIRMAREMCYRVAEMAAAFRFALGPRPKRQTIPPLPSSATIRCLESAVNYGFSSYLIRPLRRSTSKSRS